MTEKGFYYKNTCRLCEGRELTKVIELTDTPPGNDFVSKDQLDKIQAVYPLNVMFCEDCHHLQLSHVVDPSILYRNNYSFVSGTSPVNVKYFADYAEKTIQHLGLKPGSLIADIGSNDGTCLAPFQKAGMNVIGIEPASNITKLANAAGIPTIDDFFCESLAKKLKNKHGYADLITTHNVCAHIDDLESVIHGVTVWLKEDGIFIMEVGYVLDVYTNVWFDTIYHEHVDFHSIAPLVRFFDKFGMEMVSVERTSPQGGSIRMIFQKKGGRLTKDGSVEALINLEIEAGINKAITFFKFNKRLNTIKRNLRELIFELKSQGKSIAAYGAPTKATTLLGYFELGANELDYLVDDNPLKQGLYSPGKHIEVISAEEMYRRKPDYLLILAWNYADPIMVKNKRYSREGGKFIIPMPEALIVENEE